MAWAGFQRDAASGVQLVGIEDALFDRYPVAGVGHAYEITMSARTVAPREAQATERAIRRLADGLAGFVVATVRSRRRLVTHVYLPSGDHAEVFESVPLPRRATIDVRVEFDPTWQRFDRVRPSGMELQSMSDFEVLATLLQAGDDGSPRPIEHRVVGVRPDASAVFLAAIEQLGVSVDFVPADRGRPARVAAIVHESAPSDVTPVAWRVRSVAERFGAVYDGWDCDVVVDGCLPDPVRRRNNRGRR